MEYERSSFWNMANSFWRCYKTKRKFLSLRNIQTPIDQLVSKIAVNFLVSIIYSFFSYLLLTFSLLIFLFEMRIYSRSFYKRR